MSESSDAALDPVCGMTVDPATAPAQRSYDGRSYHFCSRGCAEKFDVDAPAYIAATRADGFTRWPGEAPPHWA